MVAVLKNSDANEAMSAVAMDTHPRLQRRACFIDVARFLAGRRVCLQIFAVCLLLFAGRDVGIGDEFRLPDDRPKLDRAELRACGLNILESRHLVLVTDVPLPQVQELPALADALFAELQKRLGPLRPDLAGSDFQVTGYLIDAKERFEKAGVLPPEAFQFRHGRHLGYQFWMNNQSAAYYRRHLLLHEFVHCFMMCEHGMRDIPPLWFTEGIAEYFATHQLADDVAQSRFGVLPESRTGFEGWGGFNVIRRTLSETSSTGPNSAESLSLENLLHPSDNSFTDDIKYAQAWALVWQIQNHPELAPAAEQLRRVRSESNYHDFEKTVSPNEWKRLSITWPLLLDSLVEGFDVARSFPSLKSEVKLGAIKPGQPVRLSIESDRDWQSSGLSFRRGQSVKVTCSGQYAVHDQPRPWISEPQGITIDYFRGRPLGEVQAMIIPVARPEKARRVPVGVSAVLTFDEESELWLQINDSASLRAGNSDSVVVTLE